MCAEQSSSLELRQQALRSELKNWERTFAEANGGRKAGKDDIKKIPDIAAKYKEYNKLRTKPSSLNESTHGTPQKSRKRKREAGELASAQHPAVLDPYDIPQPLSTTPRATRISIGPTPQKNGQVLGLFDMLSPEATRTATPSKLKLKQSSADALLQTPSRRNPGTKDHQPVPLDTTPSSSAKRRQCNPLQTPSSKRQQILNEVTPVSNRLNVATQPCSDRTPAFLKRYCDPSTFTGLDDGHLTYSPPQMRLPRKPVGRSLSQLVRSLREQEDERLDEELALMREIETGESAPVPKLLVQDSQICDLPLGADGEHGEPEQETSKDDAEPRRLWKKKGQKRTTRKVNIGVNRAKWKPEAEWEGGNETDDEHIPETQAVEASNRENAELEPGNKSKEVKKPRKINPNATSHANFRSLKIRNKNSKGRKGGRFGRR